jgi:hypothetical protein
MASETLNCWHCGATLEAVPLPIGRREECSHCAASLHVCRQCHFFDRSANRMCHEPMADEVTDKELANFCDYFRPRAGLAGAVDPEAAKSRARLEALFGGSSGGKSPAAGPRDPAARPKREQD